MAEPAHILVAVSLEPSDEPVLEEALRLATMAHAILDIVHVAPDEASDFVGYEIGPESVRESVAHHLRDERHDVQSLRTKLATTGVTIGQILTVRGDIPTLIIAEAKRLGVDMLVVGASHRHGLLGWLHSGTTEQIVAGLPCKVLIVPAG